MIEKQDYIIYEKFLAGAFLRFRQVSMVDFNILIEKFEKETGLKIGGKWDELYEYFGRMIRYESNGTFIIFEDIDLEHETIDGLTYVDLFKKLAGEKIVDFFTNLDLEQYEKEKEKRLLEYKQKFLKKANILFLSFNKDDYEELLKYGAQNVDYFRSRVRAAKYFQQHPEEIKKYNIIIKGDYFYYGPDVMDEFVRPIQYDTYCVDLGNYLPNFVALDFYPDRNIKSSHECFKSFSQAFDRIIEKSFAEYEIRGKFKEKEFKPIEDHTNIKSLKLPTKKADLKILCCNNSFDKYAPIAAEDLGLNITYCDYSPYDIVEHAGEYDLIIVGNPCEILKMQVESTEQCKDTGRKLTLLCSTTDRSFEILGSSDVYATEVYLDYTYGGKLAYDDHKFKKHFNVLRPSDIDDKPLIYEMFYINKAILEQAVILYNEALIKANQPSLTDLDFKTAEEYDEEFKIVRDQKWDQYQKEKKELEKELAPIKEFDIIISNLNTYLRGLKDGSYFESDDLIITEEGENIKIENIYGRRICSVFIIPKKIRHSDLRIFQIQTLSKKGTLSKPQSVGLYPSKYDNLENIPPRPNEQQQQTIIALGKKVEFILEENKCNQNSLNNKKMSLKKKRHNKKY